MVTVYRAYSPSRDKGGRPYADRARARAVNQADVRNQATVRGDADWTVQTGTIEWDTQ